MEENKNSPPSTDDSSQQSEQLNIPSTDVPIASSETSTEVEHSEIPPLGGTEPNPSTLTLQPLNPDMEVHHHTHHEHGKRNWKSYFWEFLMLFLAVFCGFLAEYQLEHKIERDREKVYMQNMLEDLKADTAIYADFASRNIIVGGLVDTLTTLIKSPERRKRISTLAYSARIMTAKWKQIVMVQRTYEDMKSSGHLRLIRNKETSESISKYYNSLSELDTYNKVGMVWAENYGQALAKLFDGEALLKIIKEKKEIPLSGDVLISEDKITINQLITMAGYFYGALSLNDNVAAIRKKTAGDLIELIKKEYKLG
jgi:hypothetical protein